MSSLSLFQSAAGLDTGDFPQSPQVESNFGLEFNASLPPEPIPFYEQTVLGIYGLARFTESSLNDGKHEIDNGNYAPMDGVYNQGYLANFIQDQLKVDKLAIPSSVISAIKDTDLAHAVEFIYLVRLFHAFCGIRKLWRQLSVSANSASTAPTWIIRVDLNTWSEFLEFIQILSGLDTLVGNQADFISNNWAEISLTHLNMQLIKANEPCNHSVKNLPHHSIEECKVEVFWAHAHFSPFKLPFVLDQQTLNNPVEIKSQVRGWLVAFSYRALTEVLKHADRGKPDFISFPRLAQNEVTSEGKIQRRPLLDKVFPASAAYVDVSQDFGLLVDARNLVYVNDLFDRLMFLTMSDATKFLWRRNMGAQAPTMLLEWHKQELWPRTATNEQRKVLVEKGMADQIKHNKQRIYLQLHRFQSDLFSPNASHNWEIIFPHNYFQRIVFQVGPAHNVLAFVQRDQMDVDFFPMTHGMTPALYALFAASIDLFDASMVDVDRIRTALTILASFDAIPVMTPRALLLQSLNIQALKMGFSEDDKQGWTLNAWKRFREHMDPKEGVQSTTSSVGFRKDLYFADKTTLVSNRAPIPLYCFLHPRGNMSFCASIHPSTSFQVSAIAIRRHFLRIGFPVPMPVVSPVFPTEDIVVSLSSAEDELRNFIASFSVAPRPQEIPLVPFTNPNQPPPPPSQVDFTQIGSFSFINPAQFVLGQNAINQLQNLASVQQQQPAPNGAVNMDVGGLPNVGPTTIEIDKPELPFAVGCREKFAFLGPSLISPVYSDPQFLPETRAAANTDEYDDLPKVEGKTARLLFSRDELNALLWDSDHLFYSPHDVAFSIQSPDAPRLRSDQKQSVTVVPKWFAQYDTYFSAPNDNKHTDFERWQFEMSKMQLMEPRSSDVRRKFNDWMAAIKREKTKLPPGASLTAGMEPFIKVSTGRGSKNKELFDVADMLNHLNSQKHKNGYHFGDWVAILPLSMLNWAYGPIAPARNGKKIHYVHLESMFKIFASGMFDRDWDSRLQPGLIRYDRFPVIAAAFRTQFLSLMALINLDSQLIIDCFWGMPDQIARHFYDLVKLTFKERKLPEVPLPKQTKSEKEAKKDADENAPSSRTLQSRYRKYRNYFFQTLLRRNSADNENKNGTKGAALILSQRDSLLHLGKEASSQREWADVIIEVTMKHRFGEPKHALKKVRAIVASALGVAKPTARQYREFQFTPTNYEHDRSLLEPQKFANFFEDPANRTSYEVPSLLQHTADTTEEGKRLLSEYKKLCTEPGFSIKKYIVQTFFQIPRIMDIRAAEQNKKQKGNDKAPKKMIDWLVWYPIKRMFNELLIDFLRGCIKGPSFFAEFALRVPVYDDLSQKPQRFWTPIIKAETNVSYHSKVDPDLEIGDDDADDEDEDEEMKAAPVLVPEPKKPSPPRAKTKMKSAPKVKPPFVSKYKTKKKSEPKTKAAKSPVAASNGEEGDPDEDTYEDDEEYQERLNAQRGDSDSERTVTDEEDSWSDDGDEVISSKRKPKTKNKKKSRKTKPKKRPILPPAPEKQTTRTINRGPAIPGLAPLPLSQFNEQAFADAFKRNEELLTRLGAIQPVVTNIPNLSAFAARPLLIPPGGGKRGLDQLAEESAKRRKLGEAISGSGSGSGSASQ